MGGLDPLYSHITNIRCVKYYNIVGFVCNIKELQPNSQQTWSKNNSMTPTKIESDIVRWRKDRVTESVS